MGMGKGGIALMLEIFKRGMLSGKISIMEIGSQEIHLRLHEFTEIIERAGFFGFDKEPFADLQYYPGTPRISCSHFYKLLGLECYKSIDINQDFGAINFDLNYPLSDSSLFNRFDVVTDFGGAEHVFNMPEVYRSIHRMCKTNGLIIAVQGYHRGNGYFGFDHAFFEGIAAANRYNILYCSLLVTPKPPTPEETPSQFHIPLSMELWEILDFTKIWRAEVCYVLQKTTDADFKIPYQGTILSEQQRIEGYKLHFLSDPPGRSYVPVISSEHARALEGESG